jgi:hypothetical protein
MDSSYSCSHHRTSFLLEIFLHRLPLAINPSLSIGFYLFSRNFEWVIVNSVPSSFEMNDNSKIDGG